ncbi:MAG: hypothetical protein COX96_06110, partial [Candidatus Omnitrophica bacterium CG_4_10_14_0_2_um_filter_44_9]
ARKGIKVQEQSCGHIRRLIGILDEVGVLEKVALDQPRAALFYYVIASFFQRHTISEIHEKLRAIGRQSLFEYYFDNTGWKPDHLNKLALHGRAGMFSSRNIHDGVEAARQAMDRAVEEILPNDFGPLHLKTPGEVYIWLAFNSGKKQVVMERLARPVKFIIQIPVAGAKAREAVISVNCKADRIGLLHDITAVLKAAQVNIKTIVTRGRKVRIAIGPAIPLSGVMAMMDIFSGNYDVHLTVRETGRKKGSSSAPVEKPEYLQREDKSAVVPGSGSSPIRQTVRDRFSEIKPSALILKYLGRERAGDLMNRLIGAPGLKFVTFLVFTAALFRKNIRPKARRIRYFFLSIAGLIAMFDLPSTKEWK